MCSLRLFSSVLMLSFWTIKKQSNLPNKAVKYISLFFFGGWKYKVCFRWVFFSNICFDSFALLVADMAKYQATRNDQQIVFAVCNRMENRPYCPKGPAEVKQWFFLAPVNLIFQICMTSTFCQSFLGTVTRLGFIYFLLIFTYSTVIVLVTHS